MCVCVCVCACVFVCVFVTEQQRLMSEQTFCPALSGTAPPFHPPTLQIDKIIEEEADRKGKIMKDRK